MLDKKLQTEIIQSLSERLRANYVFPDVAEKVCEGLSGHLDAGDYADITEGEFFAYALTTHMQEICLDEHLWVKCHSEPLPDDEESLRLSEIWRQEQLLQAKISNYGFHKTERMAGNVGYLEIRYLDRPSWGGHIAVAAMNFLANTDALIIDLTNCTGGYPGMVSLVSSYLLGEEPAHLNSIYWRDDDATQQYWTLPYVPGPRLDDKPLYILISKNTFSGGEGFAYDMQARKRAVIIGEQTDGGAHPGASYRLHPHFEVFIPIGNPIHPITGKNWEGVGIAPDIPVSAELALKAAHKMALQEIIKKLGRSKSEPLRILLAEAQAAYKELENEQ
jgi:C-terminal processing protease CtpA/Prc